MSTMKKTKIRFLIIIVARAMPSEKLKKHETGVKFKPHCQNKFAGTEFCCLFKYPISIFKHNYLEFFREGFWVLEPAKVAFLCGFCHLYLGATSLRH